MGGEENLQAFGRSFVAMLRNDEAARETVAEQVFGGRQNEDPLRLQLLLADEDAVSLGPQRAQDGGLGDGRRQSRLQYLPEISLHESG
jgi:hypothetical protein